MMRILQILSLDSRHVGGAETYAYRTAELLEQGGHSVAWVVPDERLMPAPLRGERCWGVGRARGFRTSKAMIAAIEPALRGFRPEIALLHNSIEFITPMVIRALARELPVAKFVHDARAFCSRLRSKILPGAARGGLPRQCSYRAGWRCLSAGCLIADRRGDVDVGPLTEQARETWLRLGELRLLRSLPAVLSYSEYMKNELVRNGLRPERIHVVGQCLRWPGSELQPAKGSVRGTPIIGAVGRWDGVKGLELLLAEVLQMPSDPPFEVELIGGGPGLAAARQTVARVGQEERIRLLGQLDSDRMREFYRRVAVLIVPSLVPEAFCAAGIEAQAHGVPVVGFDAGAITEWLIDGRTGFVVPMGDQRGLGEAILRLLRDPEQARTLGARARARVLELYESTPHIANLERVLRVVAAAA